MPSNVLTAIISADGAPFTKTLGQLQQQLKTFETGLKNAGSADSFNRLNRAIEATKQRIDTLKNIGNPLRSITGGANQAGIAVSNMSRVIQDAPFGFIGISNNINPLVESFQRLKTESGSVGGAVKSLVGSLAGGAGLGLAVSAVTSLLVVFGDKLGITGKTFSDTDFEADKFRQTIDEIAESFKKLKERLEFEQLVNSLKFQINDAEKIVKDFRDGIERDQGFGLQLFNISQTKANSEELTAQLHKDKEKIEQQITSLIHAIGDRGGDASDLLAEFAFKLPDIPDNLIQKLGSTDQQLLSNLKNSARERDRINGELDQQSKRNVQAQLETQLVGLQKQRELNKQKVEDAKKSAEKLIDQAISLESFFSKTLVPLHFDFDPKAPKQDQAKAALAFIKKAIETDVVLPRTQIPFEPEFKFNPKFTAIVKDEAAFHLATKEDNLKTLETIRKEFEENINKLFERSPVNVNPKFKINRDKDFEKKMENATNEIKEVVKSSSARLFEGLGESLGDVALGKDFGKGLIEALGGLISQIGKALIQYGVIKEGLDKILGPGGISIPGGVAIALGIFAIASGKLLQNAFKGARAMGGPVTGGAAYLVGERGPELFVPNTGGNIIPNSSLARGTGARFASATPILIMGEFRQRGNDLVAVISSTQRQQGRLG